MYEIIALRFIVLFNGIVHSMHTFMSYFNFLPPTSEVILLRKKKKDERKEKITLKITAEIYLLQLRGPRNNLSIRLQMPWFKAIFVK